MEDKDRLEMMQNYIEEFSKETFDAISKANIPPDSRFEMTEALGKVKDEMKKGLELSMTLEDRMEVLAGPNQGDEDKTILKFRFMTGHIIDKMEDVARELSSLSDEVNKACDETFGSERINIAVFYGLMMALNGIRTMELAILTLWDKAQEEADGKQ